MNIWEQSFEDLRRPHLEEKKGDGNLANNYPPYDKVTRGDVIAGATGKDQMGGKKKKMKSEERKLGGGMRPGGGYDRGYKAMQKEIEKLESGKEPATAKRYKEMRKEHSDWRSDLGFFIEEDCGSGPMKPKKGIKNKITINPDLKTEENISEVVGLAIKAGLAAGTALAGKAVYDRAKEVAGKMQQRNQQTQKAINQLRNSFEPEGEDLSEREMTSGEMKKEKELKKKYDPSGMKSSMKKQYGAEKGKEVYFATIRKKAMEQFEDVEDLEEGEKPFPHKKVDRQVYDAMDSGETAGDSGDSAKEKRDYDRANKMRSVAAKHGGKKRAEKKTMEQFEEVEVLDEVLDTPERANEYGKKAVGSMLGAAAKAIVSKKLKNPEMYDKHVKTIVKRIKGVKLAKRKAEKKAANEEFAGNYEGPLYAPHPDIEEAYKEIDREKENKMYRRAGNLARTALSSKGKKKEDAMKKSSNIVSAITRQKEKERFDRIGQSPKHNEALENELDYYLGEALRPASERMKNMQTSAGRKKQEQERTRKSKLEAEADKILAGFSKKGIGLAKTKPMSERREMDEPGERDDRPDVKRHNKMVGYRPKPKRPSIANDPRYGTVQDKSGKWKY